jgi:hypothetical protein
MKYLVIIVGLFASTNALSQDRFSLAIGAGIGTWKMEGLKKFQDKEERYWNPDYASVIDDFPAGPFYSAEAAFRVGNRISFGLVYRTHAAESKSEYAGVNVQQKLQQKAKADNIGILVDYRVWQKNKFSLSGQARVLYGWTKVKFTYDDVFYWMDPPSYHNEVTDEGTSIMLNPDVCFSYGVLKHLSLSLTVGYCFDFKGELENAPGAFPSTVWMEDVTYDWSGARIGFSTSFKF